MRVNQTERKKIYEANAGRPERETGEPRVTPGTPPPLSVTESAAAWSRRRGPAGLLPFTEPLPSDTEHTGFQVPAEQSPNGACAGS